MKAFFILLTISGALATARSVDLQEFALRDNDVVVFLGDSITAARTYGKIIENYTLLRFPERKVHFYNMGKGGETADGALSRLERDVFGLKPTVLTVAYGINDIGWGAKADAEHKAKYLRGIRTIVEECRRRNIRVYICSAAITGADPNKSENDFLQTMCDEGMALSRSLGEGSIDVQRTMRAIQKKVWAANEKASTPKDRSSLHAEDTIHLNDFGHIAMAFAILKGLGAPADISAATIDATSNRVIAANGCSVSNIKRNGSVLEFVRLDQGLPLNLGLVGILSYRFVPIPDELNRYILTVRGLPVGTYEVIADGRLVSKYSSQELAAGVNLGSSTPDPWEPGGPWDAQATVLRSLTDARSEMLAGLRAGDFYLPDKPKLASIHRDVTALNADLEQLQRKTAKPAPYHFIIRPEGGAPAQGGP
jgi:lysophospholipase L1-like esterase